MIELLGAAPGVRRGVLSNDYGMRPRQRAYKKRPKKINKYAVIRKIASQMRKAILQGGASYNDEHYQVAMSYPELQDTDLRNIEQEQGQDLSIYIRDLYTNFLQANQ